MTITGRRRTRFGPGFRLATARRRSDASGSLQAFLPRISKSRPVFAKDFQRFLWRFCVISRGYRSSKPYFVSFQIFGLQTPNMGAARAPPAASDSDVFSTSFES